MEQSSNLPLNAVISRDEQGVTRSIFFRAGRLVEARTSVAAALAVLNAIAQELGIAPDELTNAAEPPQRFPSDARAEFRFCEEKQLPDTITVAFYQTVFGLPVWEAGLSVTMKPAPYRVIRVQSTRHPNLFMRTPSDEAVGRFNQLGPQDLTRLLNLDAATKPEAARKVAMWNGEPPTINRKRFMVYRYDAARRLDDERKPIRAGDRPQALHDHGYTLPIPPVSDNILNGEHYVVVETLFSLRTNTLKTINWLALIEIETGSVLRLRALIANATGMVFQSDPSTQDPAAAPSQSAATLDTYRTSVTLPNVNVPAGLDPWTLDGTNVAVDDFEIPTIAPPSEASGAFNYASRTNNFAAVNTYYHCDRFFRYLQDLGFTLSSYFDGTTFPIHVDHRGHYLSDDGIEVNASCPGNALSNGIGQVNFELCDLTDTENPLGIACDWRVVLHELGGHGILWDHVNSANFGFSHSAGDSFAAILNDPATAASDRFETLPFTIQSVSVGLRRHDRDVAAGWAWGGSKDDRNYGSEQILSTAHFRIYRSIGGDSTSLSMREFASRFTAYLIASAVGTLTQATNPSDPADYVDALIAADAADWSSEGQQGGAYGKVIRWAFEKQGLYQPAGTPRPITTVGAPPAVDVYIDDGRAGEYPYQPVHWDNQDIWNRRIADGMAGHEEPIVSRPNFAYVIVKNRGTTTATGISVSGYHCNPGSGLVWPDDWQPMTTSSLTVPDLAPGATATVGPFEWQPSQLAHECMLMIVTADDDPSNAVLFTGGSDSIPEWRLVPNDNNVGQRNVHPVAGSGGFALVESIRNRPFTVKNSFPGRATVQLDVTLPKFLSERGWQLRFVNQEQGQFTLDAGEKREMRMELLAGKDFTEDEVRKVRQPPRIDIRTIVNGIPVGGMSFYLDPNHVDHPVTGCGT